MIIATPRIVLTAGLLALLSLSAGCASDPKSAETKKTESQDEYVTVAPPVGSHVRKKVKKSELAKETGVGPTKTEVITGDTDMRAPTQTTGQVDPTGGR